MGARAGVLQCWPGCGHGGWGSQTCLLAHLTLPPPEIPPLPISLHLILTGPAASVPPETSGMLLYSADVILGTLNMIKLTDVFLFYFFSAWRLFSRGEAIPWGQVAQRSLAAGWVTRPEKTQQQVQSHSLPHPHRPRTSSQMCPLPAPMGALLPPDRLGTPDSHPSFPYKAALLFCCHSRAFAPERQVSASSFREAPHWVHTPHRSEGNCHLLL